MMRMARGEPPSYEGLAAVQAAGLTGPYFMPDKDIEDEVDEGMASEQSR